MKLALCMIVKDEDKELERLFATTKGVFDEVIVAWNGTNPRTKEICEANGCRVVPYTWIDNFAHARNFSFAQSDADLLMWLDADDELINPGELRTTLTNAFSNSEVKVVEMPYHYDHDQYGNCVMKLWNARVIRKNSFSWKGAIHECLLPNEDFKKCRIENVFVRHTVDPDRVRRSAERNLRICKREYEREHSDGQIDPRTTLYYAKSLVGMGEFKDAIEIYEEYLTQSDWDDEKYEVLCTLADFHTRSRQYSKAQDYARSAITLRPLYGQAYFELSEIFYRLEKWEECIHFIEIGMRSKCPDAILPVDPSEYNFRPLLMLEFSLFQLARFQESLATIEQALKLQPKNAHLIERRKTVMGMIARIELENSAIRLMKWLSRDGEKDKLKPFVQSLPDIVRDHPYFNRLINLFGEKGNGKNRIVIYCGPTFETWDPSYVNTQGLGGSEEAVVYLSKELLKLGWVVDVYNNCPAPGNFEGVEYKQFWTHDCETPCDIFIAWRNSEYVTLAPKESRVFVWLHDRQKLEYWTPERVERTEKIIVLSEYHRNDLPHLPNEKFMISRNGIVPSHFAAAKSMSRDPLKCFYASSPDRGLDILLEVWPEILSKVPDAHLHVFYGFSKTYDLLHKDRDTMIEFKERILQSLKQDGVHYHGKVSHPELHEHMMTSGLWLYPTHFTEISCITAMKAQAAGAIPITMSLAALDETVQHGYKISFGIQDTRSRKSFTNITIDLLKNPSKQEKIREPMMKWAQDKFAWSNVALSWDKLFKTNLTDPATKEFSCQTTQ